MAKAKKTNNPTKLSLETRIAASFALLEFCRLDAQNLSDEDINTLFNRVQEIMNAAVEENNDDAFETALKYDLEPLTSPDKLKERIQRSQVVNAYKTLGYFGLCSGTEHTHLPNAQEITATLLHNLKFKDADDLADKIFHKTLDDETAQYLFTEVNKRKIMLLDSLRTDFRTYDSRKQPHPLIENIRPDLEEYTHSSKTKTLEIPFSCYEDDEFRQLFKDEVRNHFDKSVRHEFLRLYGYLMASGKQTAEGHPNLNHYEAFKKFIASEYGDKTIDNVLNISETDLEGKDIETVRKEKFKLKGEELYFKTVAALLSEKNDYNQKYNTSCDWTTFVTGNVNNYIKGLLDGRNDIRALALVDPNSDKSGKDIYQDAVGDQYVAVHHGNSTVAASYDVTRCLYPQLFQDARLESPEMKRMLQALEKEVKTAANPEERKEIRRKHRKSLREHFLKPIFQKAIDTACALTNQKSGFVLVVGKAKHQSMEPRDKITVKSNSDNSIMAARINPVFLQSISSKLPPKLWEGIQKYVHPDVNKQTQEISAALPLPEHKTWTEVRSKLQAEEKKAVSVLNKHQRYSY